MELDVLDVEDVLVELDVEVLDVVRVVVVGVTLPNLSCASLPL